MISGFKTFIMKGNVVDLAVAVVIGTAFGAVIKALVEGLLMPLVAAIFGSPNLDSFAQFELNGTLIQPGLVLTALVNFLLIAAAIYFIVVVPMNKMIARRNARLGIAEEETAVEPQVALLTEIRDELRTRRG